MSGVRGAVAGVEPAPSFDDRFGPVPGSRSESLTFNFRAEGAGLAVRASSSSALRVAGRGCDHGSANWQVSAVIGIKCTPQAPSLLLRSRARMNKPWGNLLVRQPIGIDAPFRTTKRRRICPARPGASSRRSPTASATTGFGRGSSPSRPSVSSNPSVPTAERSAVRPPGSSHRGSSVRRRNCPAVSLSGC
jgi:hypothetical protein